MSRKLASGGCISHDTLTDDLLINPFVHHLDLGSNYEKIKRALLTVFLLPIRVSIICFLLVAGWLLAVVGLWGLTEEDLRVKPLVGWRRKLTPLLCFVGQSVYRVGGMNVVVKGKQATRKEAPILVFAPHSTFLDGGIIYATGYPSIIVRRESGTNPYLGKLINFTQPVYVWRDDPDSRQNTIKEIISRATSDQDWPQILIFPEGTCTNRSCLITFKPGAFYPGVPIQPVCIRYPNELDTVTWTWEGPSALKLLWLTLTQTSSYCEIEFLPVYVPSEAEKSDPKLFANNVRAVMAKALGIPVSDYTYGDCRLIAKSKEMNLPNAVSLVEVQKMRQRLSLDKLNTEEALACRKSLKSQPLLDYAEFCSVLSIPKTNISNHLFRIYDKGSTGLIDIREYLLGVLVLEKNLTSFEAMKLACDIFDSRGDSYLSPEDFSKALYYTLAVEKSYGYEIFADIDRHSRGFITCEDFVQYARKKAEFSHLFSLSSEERLKSPPNICVNDLRKED